MVGRSQVRYVYPWGVYSVPAGIYKEKDIPGGEWIMNNAKIPVAEYKKYASEFNPVNYDPEAWVKMAKDWNHPGGAAMGGHWDAAQNGSMDEYLDLVQDENRIEIKVPDEAPDSILSVVEPWHPWDNHGQEFTPKYCRGERWCAHFK